MTVSKRLRFEILKRDGFRCYYCGTRGTETGAGLTVDHVVPTALGGTDDAQNLVAACGDCNSGKSSMPADAGLVAEVDRAAAAHRAGRAIALDALRADIEAEATYTDAVWDAWDRIFPSYARDNTGLESLASDWFKRGVPPEVVEKALRIAWESRAGRSQKLRYAGGVVNNLMSEAEDRAQSIAAGNNVIFNAGYDSGFNDGQIFEESRADLLEMHIDGRRDGFYAVMASENWLPWKVEPYGS